VANRLEIVATNIITSKGICMLGKIKHHTEHDTIQKKAKQIRSPSAEHPLIHQKEPKFKTQRPITKSKRNRHTTPTYRLKHGGSPLHEATHKARSLRLKAEGGKHNWKSKQVFKLIKP